MEQKAEDKEQNIRNIDIKTFMELLAQDLKIDDATQKKKVIDLAQNFQDKFVFNTVQLCLMDEDKWGQFDLPVALVPTIKAKLKFQDNWQQQVAQLSEKKEVNVSSLQDDPQNFQQQGKVVEIYHLNRQFKMRIFEEVKQQDIVDQIYDLIGEPKSTKLLFLDAEGNNVVLSANIPNGTKIHVSVFVPPEQVSHQMLGSQYQYWADCSYGEIHNTTEKSLCLINQGESWYGGWAQTPILPAQGKLELRLKIKFVGGYSGMLGLIEDGQPSPKFNTIPEGYPYLIQMCSFSKQQGRICDQTPYQTKDLDLTIKIDREMKTARYCYKKRDGNQYEQVFQNIPKKIKFIINAGKVQNQLTIWKDQSTKVDSTNENGGGCVPKQN